MPESLPKRAAGLDDPKRIPSGRSGAAKEKKGRQGEPSPRQYVMPDVSDRSRPTMREAVGRRRMVDHPNVGRDLDGVAGKKDKAGGDDGAKGTAS